MTLCFSLLWQCHVCKFFSSFGLGRCFLPEATAFRDLIKPGCPFPHFPVPSPHLPLPHQASPAIRGRMPGGHKDQVRVAKLRQEAQGSINFNRKLSLGTRWMERLCPVCQPCQQPQDNHRQEQWCPPAEATLFVSWPRWLFSPAGSTCALEKTWNFQLLQLYCDSASGPLWPHYEIGCSFSGTCFLFGALPCSWNVITVEIHR